MDTGVRLVNGGWACGELRFTETHGEIELNRALQMLWERVTPSLFEKIEHHSERSSRHLSKQRIAVSPGRGHMG